MVDDAVSSVAVVDPMVMVTVEIKARTNQLNAKNFKGCFLILVSGIMVVHVSLCRRLSLVL